jgi:Tol biopolymer transport system component
MTNESQEGGQPAASISAGDRLGRFEIVGLLGAGGMGAVYRARDPQLLRDVAIKVLPDTVRHNPDRQRRFEREARTVASLNHPNVLAVHDFGVHEGIAFIVTELLEGETLRHRMAGRAMPPRLALDYAIQIASGLAAGHDRGIVHRDIKPENVFVTKDGRIKILDFGLAKAIGTGPDDATLTFDGEAVTPIAGTAAYMAPEQARGLAADHRADIFSFGVVLYEMLAGFSPFRRRAGGETLAAVLHDDPPALRDVAPELERIVLHCLDKSPEQRFQNARDLIFGLQALPGTAAASAGKMPSPRTAKAQIRIALLLLAVVIAVVSAYFARRPRARVAETAAVPRVQRLTDFPGIEEAPAVSPDGRSVAFTASVDGRRQIFIRLIAGGLPVQLTHDAVDHQLPRWSPDGNSLMYFSAARADEVEGEIWSIPALGGSPRRVIDSIGGADVGKNGRLTCFRLSDRRVQLVTSSLEGADIRVLAAFIPGYHLYPRWSPDGRWIAFQRGDGLRYDVFVISRDGGEPRQLTHDRALIKGLAWLPDSGGIVYASSRETTFPYLPPLALWQVGLDGRDPRQITPADIWYEQPDVHGSGLLSAARVLMRFDIWSFPFDADPAANVKRAMAITRQTGRVLTPTAAPDGDQIAFLSDSGGHGNVWVQSIRSGQQRQLTFEDDPRVTIGVPLWSPDGRSIAFVSSKGHTGYDFGIWLVGADGRNLRKVAEQGLGVAWSPDSEWLYYAETSAGVLNKVRASGGKAVRVRTEATRNVIGVRGTTLYYTVQRVLLDGRPELEIRAATPENGPSRSLARISASRVPSWQIVNPSLSPDGEWMAIPLTDGFTTNIWALSTRSGAWRQVTDFGDRATFIARRVSWSADGRSILAALGEGDADIVIVKDLIARR